MACWERLIQNFFIFDSTPPGERTSQALACFPPLYILPLDDLLSAAALVNDVCGFIGTDAPRSSDDDCKGAGTNPANHHAFDGDLRDVGEYGRYPLARACALARWFSALGPCGWCSRTAYDHHEDDYADAKFPVPAHPCLLSIEADCRTVTDPGHTWGEVAFPTMRRTLSSGGTPRYSSPATHLFRNRCRRSAFPDHDAELNWSAPTDWSTPNASSGLPPTLTAMASPGGPPRTGDRRRRPRRTGRPCLPYRRFCCTLSVPASRSPVHGFWISAGSMVRVFP